MANALPLPANQVGSPCERRSPASGKARHISRRRSTSGASREEMVLTGCVWGFAAGGTARGAPFFAVAFGAVVLMVACLAADRLLTTRRYSTSRASALSSEP